MILTSAPGISGKVTMGPGQMFSGVSSDAFPSSWTYNPATNSYVAGKYGAVQPHDLGKEYLGKYNAFSNPTAGQVEGGKSQGFFYNPTGKPGGFTSLTSSAFDNPNVFENVRNRYLQFGNDPVWLEQLNKASDTAKKKFEGSSFKMDPGVLKKMWTPGTTKPK